MGLGKQHSFKWAGHIVVRFPNPLASWQLGNLTSHIAILTARQQSVWFDAMKRTSLNSSQLKLEGTLPYSAVRGIHPNWWVAAKKEFHVLCFGIILGGILTNLIDHQKAGGELWRRWNISRPLWPGQREYLKGKHNHTAANDEIFKHRQIAWPWQGRRKGRGRSVDWFL